MGIVRQRKVEVATDIPARRIADLPVELDDRAGRSIREAEQSLAKRMVARYESALETHHSGRVVDGIDHDLVRQVATWERQDSRISKSEENVFIMMRRIGRAKAGGPDFAAQLAAGQRRQSRVLFSPSPLSMVDGAPLARKPYTRTTRIELHLRLQCVRTTIADGKRQYDVPPPHRPTL